MLTKELLQKKSCFMENYERLKQELDWKVDKRIIFILASQYARNERVVNVDTFLALDERIKKEAGFFTVLDSNVRRCLTALFETSLDNPLVSVPSWKENYELLVGMKFSRTVFTYLSAYQLLFTQQDEREEVVETAFAIYKEMRKEHFFLTGSEDYPAVMFLATVKDSKERIVKRAKDYYQALGERGFSKGNDLQFLANILASSDEEKDDAVSRVIAIKEQFERCGIKIRSIHYASLGILCLMKLDKSQLWDITELIKELREEKVLRWHKDLVVSLGIELYAKTQVEDRGFIDMSFLVALQTLIQAQQVAAIAAAT